MRWKFFWKDTKIPASRCPYCDTVFDGALSPDGNVPSPGDYSICKNCVSFLKFGDDMELLPVSQDEINELENYATEFMEKIKKLQGAVRDMDRRPKT